MITKQTYTRKLYPITVICLIILILIARLMWGWGNPSAEPYSDFWETISGLGDWKQSPVGFIYFQFWGLVFGVFILHVIRYIHQNMMHFKEYPIKLFGIKPILTRKKPIKFKNHNLISFTSEDPIKIGTFFLLLAGIGFSLMGLVPDGVVTSISKFHEISAGVGFGGIFFANAFYASVLDQAMRENKINKKLHILSQILWWFLIIGTIITFGIAELYYKPMYDLGWYGPEWSEAGVPVIVSFPIWERIGFIVGCVYMGLIGFILPEKEMK